VPPCGLPLEAALQTPTAPAGPRRLPTRPAAGACNPNPVAQFWSDRASSSPLTALPALTPGSRSSHARSTRGSDARSEASCGPLAAIRLSHEGTERAEWLRSCSILSTFSRAADLMWSCAGQPDDDSGSDDEELLALKRTRRRQAGEEAEVSRRRRAPPETPSPRPSTSAPAVAHLFPVDAVPLEHTPAAQSLIPRRTAPPLTLSQARCDIAACTSSPHQPLLSLLLLPVPAVSSPLPALLPQTLPHRRLHCFLPTASPSVAAPRACAPPLHRRQILAPATPATAGCAPYNPPAAALSTGARSPPCAPRSGVRSTAQRAAAYSMSAVVHSRKRPQAGTDKLSAPAKRGDSGSPLKSRCARLDPRAHAASRSSSSWTMMRVRRAHPALVQSDDPHLSYPDYTSRSRPSSCRARSTTSCCPAGQPPSS
jgi:hypothetical protein